jgi:hypothetical protein
VAALLVVLCAGAPRLFWDAHVNPNMGTGYHVRVTPEQAQAARWVRGHSSPDDMVATNVHRVSPQPDPSWSLSYWVPGFTERRVLIGSWGYSNRAVETGQISTFWDPDLLSHNDAAIYATSPADVVWLRAHGVRWVLVDRRYGAESPELARLTTLRWERSDTAVYEVPRSG